MDSLDEKLAAMGTERERALLLDIDRREQNVNSLFMKAARLTAPLPLVSFDLPFERPPSSIYCTGVDGRPLGCVADTSAERGLPYLTHSLSAISLKTSSSAVESEETDFKSDLVSSSSPADDLAASIAATAAENAADVIDDYTFMVKDFYPPRAIGLKQVCLTSSTTTAATSGPIFYKTEKEGSQQFKEEMNPPDDAGSVAVKVVFDGPNRTICDFVVKVPPSPLSNRVCAVKEGVVEANADDTEEAEDWVQRHLIFPEILDQDSKENFSDDKFREASLEVMLGSYSSLDAEETVILSDKVCTVCTVFSRIPVLLVALSRLVVCLLCWQLHLRQSDVPYRTVP